MPQPLPTLATRAAMIATSAVAAAVLATLPVGSDSPAVPSASAVPVVTAPVAPVAHTVALSSAAAGNIAAATRAAAPAAVRASAMQNALGKVGAPYRWGATGPRAFDCSGLVTYAYKSAGRSLPRTARAMSRVGTPVSKGSLRPGDLVFFYKASHVAIYVGNGKVVHASNPRHPVRVTSLNSMPYHSARRV